MKFLKQFGIILLISFVGEICHSVIPLPIPASIYGIVIMFVCLFTGIIKVEDIKQTSIFLIEIMPIMFVPAGVGLVESFDIFRSAWVEYMLISVVTTIFVMVVAGRITQAIITHSKNTKVRAVNLDE